MSCNGCRALRKRCSEDCILRTSLHCLPSPSAQSNATLFLAKFFGRADLLSFLSAVPLHHRSTLLQSLLFEACGRTINPVSGAVGLLCSGNWRVCQVAVDTVLSGAVLRPISSEFLATMLSSSALVGGGRETTSFESDVLSEGSFENGDDGARRKRKVLDLFV